MNYHFKTEDHRSNAALAELTFIHEMRIKIYPLNSYKKEPRTFVRRCGANTWRRPTLTGPIVPLPSALRRFTSGFGMGPGGSNALWSPEVKLEALLKASLLVCYWLFVMSY